MGKHQKYLITGSNGYVAKFMIQHLLDKGVNSGNIRATDIQEKSDFADSRSVPYVQANLLKPDSLEKTVEGINIIFNFAAAFDYSLKLGVMDKVNVDGLENLLKAAKRSGVKRLVHSSSAAVYGPDFAGADEEHPKRPVNDYEVSKFHSEEKLADYKDKLEITIVRPIAIWGADPKIGGSIYGANMLVYLASLNLLNARLKDGDKNYGQFADVRDVVHAMWFLHDKEEAVGDAYNVGGNTFTYDEIIKEMRKIQLFNLPEEFLFRIPRQLADIGCKLNTTVARLTATMPVAETGFVNYFFANNYFDTAKLEKLMKKHGERLHHKDIKKGIPEVIEWMKKEGYYGKIDGFIELTLRKTNQKLRVYHALKEAYTAYMMFLQQPLACLRNKE